MMLRHCILCAHGCIPAACQLQQAEGEPVLVQLLHAPRVCKGRPGSGLPTQLELLLTCQTTVSRGWRQLSTGQHHMAVGKMQLLRSLA